MHYCLCAYEHERLRSLCDFQMDQIQSAECGAAYLLTTLVIVVRPQLAMYTLLQNNENITTKAVAKLPLAEFGKI